MSEQLVVGLVSISDRAFDRYLGRQGYPGLQEWFVRADHAVADETRLIADDQPTIEQAPIELVDTVGCHLVLTTGGTGPARRDVTPEATLAVADKEMPAFGEEMRRISLNFVPTAILSRQVGSFQAGTDHQPARPAEIDQGNAGRRTPPTARTGAVGIFAAVPYCIDLIGGLAETNETVVKAFRPKSAIRTK